MLQQEMWVRKRMYDLTFRVYIGDMDPELLTFLKRYVDSFTKVDLLRFFHHNPHTIDTVENIAHYAGRDQETVQRELTQLATRGLLEKTQLGQMVVYALADKPQLRKQLADFVTASNDPQFRIRLIYYLVKGGHF